MVYKNEFDDNVEIVFLKIFAIFYVSVLYVIFGVYITTMLDEYGFVDMLVSNDHHNKTNDSVFKLVVETAIVVGIIAVFAFIGRNLIQLIPFPFDGFMGFKYDDVKEVAAGNILLVFMFTFSSVLFNRIELLREKLNVYKQNKQFNVEMKYFEDPKKIRIIA
jgi:hypothetical protein